LRDAIGFSSVQADADKHSKDRWSVPEQGTRCDCRHPHFSLFAHRDRVRPMCRDLVIPTPGGVKSCRQSPADAVDRTAEFVNNVFIRLAALIAVLAYPGIAFAQGTQAVYCSSPIHGVVPMAASPASA
jgi:hypothetical protein